MDISYLNTKRIRKERKMSLRDLSAKSGLSISFLSNYENGKVNISIAALYQIAQALEVPIKLLLATEEDHTLLVVPHDSRYGVIQHKTSEGTAIQEFLTRGATFDMQVTVMHLPPHMNSGQAAKHKSEEFLFVLSGTVILMLDMHEDVTLQKGDMAYYDANFSHSWRNPADEEVEFLLVASKTGF
ncbi:MAG: XRE family transcriptional regulator [Candidatus Pelethousia sp.]|nr:XRE family transcriptional regulator [Candidatus Pelethousia sp.]